MAAKTHTKVHSGGRREEERERSVGRKELNLFKKKYEDAEMKYVWQLDSDEKRHHKTESQIKVRDSNWTPGVCRWLIETLDETP